MENMQLDERVLREYENNTSILNRNGTTSVAIKGWAISFSTAVTALKKDDIDLVFLLFLSTAILAFWFIEAVYRHIMNLLKSRQLKIEEYFETGTAEKLKSPYFFTELKGHFRFPYVLRAALEVRVCPIYILLLLALTMYFLFSRGA